MADKSRLKHRAIYIPKIKQNTHRNWISNDRNIWEHASNLITKETGTKHRSQTGNEKPGTKEENHLQKHTVSSLRTFCFRCGVYAHKVILLWFNLRDMRRVLFSVCIELIWWCYTPITVTARDCFSGWHLMNLLKKNNISDIVVALILPLCCNCFLKPLRQTSLLTSVSDIRLQA